MKKSYEIKVPHFYYMEYYEGDKRMIIDIDLRDPKIYLHKKLIGNWEVPYENINIDEQHKRLILENLREHFLRRGLEPEDIIIEYGAR